MTLVEHWTDREDREPPLIEPEIIQDVLLNGGAMTVEDGMLRVVGWIKPFWVAGGEPSERRVVVRFSMPLAAAQRFYKSMGTSLSA
jgi:hypothetical protein